MKKPFDLERIMATIKKMDIAWYTENGFPVEERPKSQITFIRKTFQILYDKYGVTFAYRSDRHDDMWTTVLCYCDCPAYAGDFTPKRLAEYAYSMWYLYK